MTASGQGRVVVVGSFNVDHVWHRDTLPRPGETLAGRYFTGPGGKGFNQATAARRAGAETTFVCALGDDAGAALARDLADIDGLHLVATPSAEPTGTAGIFVDAQGRNSIVIGPGANADLDEAAIARSRDAIAASSVMLVQMESPVPAVKTALKIARESGATTLLNPAPADAQVDAELLSLTDILTPNESEFAGICRRQLSQEIDADALANMDDAALHDLCRQLLPHGSVVVTLGTAGCFVSHAADGTHRDQAACYRVPAETVEAVDTTGAGDAFNGALAAALASDDGTSFRTHVAFATRYAAASVEHQGAASGMPLLAEVEARFGSARAS